MKERDYLGLTPKESNDLAPKERELRRKITASAGDSSECSHPASSPEEILLAAEDERGRRMKIEAFAETLPADLAALLNLWRQDVPPTEARRRLGLPKSRENALRNRLVRYRKRLTAA